MQTAVASVATAINRTWTLAGRSRSSFTAVAHAELTRMPSWAFNVSEVMAFVASRPGLPHRVYDVFSDVPVVLYDTDGMALELLVWNGAAPGIHGHPVEGAFRVLHGSSVHAVYRFDEHERVSDDVRVGSVVQQHLEVLQAPDARPIPSDAEHLHHQTLHVERPSVTLVAHNDERPASCRHFVLYPPGVAVAVPIPPVDRRLPALWRLLEFAAVSGLDAPVRFLRENAFDLGIAGFVRVFLQFSSAVAWIIQTDHDGSWHARVADLLGPAGAAALLEAHEWGWRRAQWLALHADEHDPALRFVAALLVMTEHPHAALQAVAARYGPSDPSEWLASHLTQISAAKLPVNHRAAPLCRRFRDALSSAPDSAETLRLFIEGTAVRAAHDCAGALTALRAIPELSCLDGGLAGA